MTLRFTLDDFDRANESWGANCGPGALAAICGLTLYEARVAVGPSWPGYTNPTAMFDALRRSGIRWTSAMSHSPEARGLPMPWPRWGLCRIQLEGPWTQPGVPIRARYRQTHWVGAATKTAGDVGVFDVNALANGSGWCALADWTSVIVPHLTADIKRASGGWHITHAIEVERPSAVAGIGAAV